MFVARRWLTLIALGFFFLFLQAPYNNAYALGPFSVVPMIANWLGIGAAVSVVIDAITGRNITGTIAREVANGGAWAARQIGATETAETIQNIGQIADSGIRGATQTIGALLGTGSLPDPDNIAARAISFAQGEPIIAPFIRGFVDIASQIGQQFGTRIAAEVLTLLNYVFLIWLLLQVAQMMLGMARGGEIFWSIVRRGAIYMILAALLAGVQSGEYWRWFVHEPLQATSSMTQAMAGSSAIGGIGGCGSPTSGDAGSSAEAIACVTERVLRGGIATGWVLIAATPFRITQPLDMPKGLGNILAGIGLCVFFGLAMIYFGFFVLDVFLRILVLAMFSPIFIALYIIQATRGVTRNAINNLIGSLFTLLGAVAVLSIVNGLISQLVGGAGNDANWSTIIRQYAQEAVNLSPNVGLGDGRYWALAFAALTLIASAKAIGGLMGGVFGGSAAGVMADKATSIATLPVKAAAAGAVVATGGATAIAWQAGNIALQAGKNASSSPTPGTAEYARRKMGWGP